MWGSPIAGEGNGGHTERTNDELTDGKREATGIKGLSRSFGPTRGKVGGNFAGAPLLLLHTIGAKSGNERINPMMYQDLGDGRVAVFASKAGQPTNPDWYHNLVANPDVNAEIGTETRNFRARTASSDERESIWTRQKQEYPGFASYEASTTREIPVVVLEPR